MANIIDQRNIQLRLVWLHKWHTGYVGFPMWEPIAQEWFDRDLRIKRIRARDYLILRFGRSYSRIPRSAHRSSNLDLTARGYVAYERTNSSMRRLHLACPIPTDAMGRIPTRRVAGEAIITICKVRRTQMRMTPAELVRADYICVVRRNLIEFGMDPYDAQVGAQDCFNSNHREHPVVDARQYYAGAIEGGYKNATTTAKEGKHG